MPTTFHGIGTHYYSKKNLRTYLSVCDQCGQASELQSYETRLWFVIVYIPIIPLGMKQILNFCPRCTRHRCISLKEWKEIESRTITENFESSTQNPEDPDAAMKLHGTFATFGKEEQADKLAELMLANFSAHAGVHLYLASWHDSYRRHTEADALYQKALALEPGNLAARRAVGIACIEKGDLTRARQLLSFMEQPGPGQDVSVLFMLAGAYAKQGQNEDALALYRLMIQNFPKLAKDHHFQKAVKKTEAAMRLPDSILPSRPIYLSPAFIGCAILLLAVLGFASVNYYLETHQTLHVVNGLAKPVTVEIQGYGPLTVQPGGHEVMNVAEGSYEARVSLPQGIVEKIPFTVSNTLSERFFRDNVHVLNPGGGATLLWQKVRYSRSPNSTGPPPNRIYLGEKFLRIRSVDYPFEPMPSSISISKYSGSKERTGVQVVSYQPWQILVYMPEKFSAEQKIRFCELHLRFNPGDNKLVRNYYRECEKNGELERARAFLEAGLAHRPVPVDWHEAYQDASILAGKAEAVPEIYERFLREEPSNPALLYLRGRIEGRSREAMAFVEQAIEADKENAFAWTLKGDFLASAGQFEAAKAAYQEALRLDPDQESVGHYLFSVRIALKEYETLKKEIEESKKDEIISVPNHLHRIQLLAALGDWEGAEKVHEEFSQRVRQHWPEDPHQLILRTRLYLFYLKGDFTALLEQSGQIKEALSAEQFSFSARVELGQLETVEDSLQAMGANTRLYHLVIGMAWRQKGEVEKAAMWREKAIAALSQGTTQEQMAASLLAKSGPVSLEEVDEIALWAQDKAILLVALADSSSPNKGSLLERAEALNYHPYFPRHFLRRAIQSLREAR